MSFEPKNITKEHILAGIQKILEDKISLKPATRWEVEINGNKYPPKEVMRYAHQAMNGELIWTYGGGEETNKWLKKFKFLIHPKSKINDPIIQLIERYKSHARKSQLTDELYKWKLVKVYNDRPNINSIDFTKEITSINFSNLIYPVGISVTHHLAKERPEEFREAFKKLFDDEIDLTQRIKSFSETTLKIYREILPLNTYSHHQDERTIATYLAFHDSSKYAFYKDSFYQKYCKLLGIKPEKKGKKLVHYLTLLNDFIENYILDDEELLDIKKDLLNEDCYEDTNHKIFAQDILYSTLDLQKGIARKYWRIESTNEDDTLWNIMATNECISIGWSEIGDLNELEINSPIDINKLLDIHGIFAGDKKLASKKATEILHFYKDIAVGDIVISQNGNEILGIGEVIGEYDFEPSLTNAHIRPVHWTLISSSIKNSEGNGTTVSRISQPDFINEIDQLLADKKQEEKMSQELNQILYGPPGTGKTFNTINESLKLCGIDPASLKDRQEIKDQFENLVNQGRIIFTTFHQSMTYEDFVEGIKPIEPEKEGDPLIYRIEAGIFKKLCIEASFSIATKYKSNNAENILDFSTAFDSFVQKIQDNLAKQQNIELATKNGGTIIVEAISQQNNLLIRHPGKTITYTISKKRLSKLHNAFPDLTAINNIDLEFRSIIGGSNSTANWAALNAIRNSLPSSTESTQKTRPYSLEDKNEVVQALGNEDYKSGSGDNYVLIIDEINRGNVSQIFGELITLIEEDKRQGKPEAIRVQLPYSKELFGVPPNVHILGTMNTADRSIEALDAALRRRFSFIEMPPKPDLIKTEGKSVNGIIEEIDLADLLKTINMRIEKLLDKDHMIGHSYFLNVSSIKDLRMVFHKKIIPLLQEYFFGDYGKIGLVVGSKFFENTENQNDEEFFAPFEEYESSQLSERRVFHIKNVFDMTDEMFSDALNYLLRK